MISKFILLSFLFLFYFQWGFGQVFINGDFETNKANDCEYNLSDIEFNTKVSNVFAFGKTFYSRAYRGETDLHTNGCYVSPQNGNWCIGLASDYLIYRTSDAIAIELSTNLQVGQSYQLSFFIFGNLKFADSLTKVMIGESLNNSAFGNLIDSIAPDTMIWKQVKLNFTAKQNSKYITVKNIPGINAWNQVDNFTISKITGLERIYLESPKLFPNPASNIVSIQLVNPANFKYAIIKDAFGKLIYNTSDLTINVSQWHSGLYFIEIVMDNGKYSTRLLKI